MKKIALLVLASVCASGVAAGQAEAAKAASKGKQAQKNRGKARTDADVAAIGASFAAAIAIADEEIYVTLLDDALLDKVRKEKWAVLALVFRNDDRPLYKSAYMLQDQGDHYLLKFPYPRQKAWTLNLLLVPPKGENRVAAFPFFDRSLVEAKP